MADAPKDWAEREEKLLRRIAAMLPYVAQGVADNEWRDDEFYSALLDLFFAVSVLREFTLV